MEILTMENVGLNYQTTESETKAIKNVTFSVRDGEFVALVGPSGCGKTTILSLISGLIKPSCGSIRFGSKEDAKVGYMLQKDTLFEWLTIEKNVLLGAKINKKISREVKKKAYALLKKYDLWEFKDSYPSELSGGMRQRAALIRTLSLKPDLLLLDEPFSALDFQTRLAVAEDVFAIIKQEEKTALLVTHDISEAVSLADKIIVLSRRPSVVKRIFDVKLAGGPLARRENPAFSDWFDKVWKEVTSEAQDGKRKVSV